jgi:hypothetical protein
MHGAKAAPFIRSYCVTSDNLINGTLGAIYADYIEKE